MTRKKSAATHSKAPRTQKQPPANERASLCSSARPARMPTIIHPMLATLVDDPFSNPEWIFETKWDGFRSVCFVKNGKARLVSRNQIEMTPQYPELAGVAKQIDAKEAILDGEIVALDKDGMPRFQLLQPRVGRKSGIEALRGHGHIVYYVFDLLYVDGNSLMPCPLVERKEVLDRILKPASFIKLSEHIDGDGEAFFKQIEKFHLEGMIAKRAASPYVEKRSKDWLKVKTIQRSEVVIGGYTQPRGSRSHFGALVVGLYRDKQLRYVAHVGGGFNQRSLAELFKLMQPLKTKVSPFVDAPKTNEPVQWLKPKLVAEVKFSEWTADQRLRHPIFVGLREDKEPEDCRFEFKRDTDQVVRRGGRKR
ncbi:MAG: bifunctional non-ous end joining protein LigD [Blastocatellia bacterium]|jgi:bifunctional non-homologous end joining protein LigD|nr:bifunctional non-ous end joining protein LigD [Blastocatellia bacterium]